MSRCPIMNFSCQRADARNNREKILKIAHEILSESPDASMNSIAKRAEVGAGTLYRHFPTREDLILSVYRYDVAQLVDSVPSVLTAYSPREALRRWVLDLASYVRIKHGLGDALTENIKREVVADTYEKVRDALHQLLDAGRDSGEINSDINADDFLTLIGSLWRITPPDPKRIDAVLDVIIAGISRSGI